MQATDVLNSSAQVPAPSTTTRVGSSAMGKDDFIKLLMAQLGNQDPTAPVDSQAFTAQLAQFSSLEQLQNVNTNLDGIAKAQASGAQGTAVSYVGKMAVVRSDQVTLTDTGPTSATVVLPVSANEMSIDVVDTTGKTIRTLNPGSHDAGTFDVPWDGNNSNGSRAVSGTYTFRVSAKDAKGQTIPVETRALGLVTGVSLESGTPQVIVNGNKINLSEILEIEQRSTP